MKKIILAIFFMLYSLNFSQVKNISDIKTLELTVKEKVFLNRKSEEKVYNIKYVVPNLMKKEMLEPKSHKGEIFIYIDDIKKTYLPIFDEVLEDKAEPEENFVIDTIVLLQNKDRKDEKFRKLYNSGKLVRIRNDNITIAPQKMKLIDDYYIPSYVKIFEGENLIAEIKIENVKINTEISRKEFEL